MAHDLTTSHRVALHSASTSRLPRPARRDHPSPTLPADQARAAPDSHLRPPSRHRSPTMPNAIRKVHENDPENEAGDERKPSSPTPYTSGGDLLSHTLPSAVPSALEGLTTGFGMSPGVSLPPSPPKPQRTATPCPTHRRGPGCCSRIAQRTQALCRQVLGLLVPVSSTRHRASTTGLSTHSSHGSLTPQSPRGGRPHLKAGFPLRCLQRLSLPNVANQPCPWRDNWHTRGSSVPVLSY